MKRKRAKIKPPAFYEAICSDCKRPIGNPFTGADGFYRCGACNGIYVKKRRVHQ